MSRSSKEVPVGSFSRKSRDNRSDVEQSRATYQRALALFDQKRWSEAADGFAEAAGADPGSSSCRLFLGVSLTNAGRWEEALEPLRACLDLRPEYSEAHNALGMALGKLGRFADADEHIVHAARLGHPQAATTMRRRGIDYCRECHRPVHRTEPGTFDVNVISPKVGVQCTACDEVFCVPCLLGDADSAFNVPCLRCGGELTVMELDR
ncbi:hypothetical protein C1I99_04115 [Micromonospora deserti]|uniref:Uncharacterized protein n=1 Tax=Micromonospora deserti TaxID=2070366 RepID=A0A2W2D9N2_9ACTN|nr:hypothetical protein C1I99_04115 [Micromonospora deserti]